MESVWHPALRPDSSNLYRQHLERPTEKESLTTTDADNVLQNDAQPLQPEYTIDANSVSSMSGLHGTDNRGSGDGSHGDSQLPVDHQSLVNDAPGFGEADPHSATGSFIVNANRFEHHKASDEMGEESGKGVKSEIVEGTAEPVIDAHTTFPSLLKDSRPVGGEDIIRAEMNKVLEERLQNEKQLPLNELSRTNSFPEIPPLLQSPIIYPHPLPRSLAEEVIEEDEKHSLRSAPLISIPSDANSISGWDDAFPASNDNGDRDFFASQSISHEEFPIPPQSLAKQNEQARFEEGLPLVKHDECERASWYPEALGTNVDAEDEEREHDSFFNSPSTADEDTSTFRPQPIDRKTTSQVLESLQYPSKEANHTISDEHDDIPSLAELTGGGIAVSTETVRSQLRAEQVAEGTDANPKDEDLADMWKAALDDDELLEDASTSLDPSTFFEDDGEGFLDEDPPGNDQKGTSSISTTSGPLQPVYGSQGEMQGFTRSQTSSTNPPNAYVPATMHSQQPSTKASSYYPTQPLVASGLTASSSMPNGFTSSQQNNIPSAGVAAPTQPHLQNAAQSFADKSKGGYTSPYDLPMDVTRPRKRPVLPTVSAHPERQHSSDRPAPPRSSSMYPGALPPQNVQPTQPIVPRAEPATIVNGQSASGPKTTPSSGSFFEELPSTKARPSSSMGRVTAPFNQPKPPPLASQGTVPKTALYEQQMTVTPPSNAQDYHLLPPERLSLFGNAPPQQSVKHSVPVINSRYSPAPQQSSTVPPPLNRYASSPAAAVRPPSAHALPHQPRTSSPLTQKTTAAYQQQEADPSYSIMKRPALSGQQAPKALDVSPPHLPSLEPQQVYTSGDQHLNSVDENMPSQYSSLAPETPSLSSSPSAPSHTRYTPGPDRSTSDDHNGFFRGPPRRSQTQSPSARKPNDIPSDSIPPYQRPASVNNYGPSPTAHDASASSKPVQRPGRGYSHLTEYIRPIDGRELDSLERWKGCPIMSFGFGGTIVKMFPQQIPRYASGQKFPMMKCSPGEVKIENGKTFALEESIATFPGPLKGKGRKKDVLDWLQRKVHDMESSVTSGTYSGRTLLDPLKCHEERVLLWKVMKILVEYDGTIEGNAASEKAVRALLSPELDQGDAALLPQTSFVAPLVGITRRDDMPSMPNPIRSEALEELRKKLLHGDRDQAVWHAVDNRLWAHAMLISSTLDQVIWKQVSQEFVRQEVKTVGENTESLAALYQVFAGNWEESIDELVPPSARAGLQMMSKNAVTGPTKNALDGLDRWRETLTLILSNRTTDDGKALVALGQLLANHGRTEAAHICYIFAKTPGLFGGPDDPQVRVALLGADHIRQPFDYGRDFDSILLTEVHDFARTTLASSSASTVSPHLQSYKLYHAMILAEYGYKAEAQQYCDSILSTLKSTTKPSPYYHGLLVGALETLQDRLRQAPRDGSGSWISKPSIDKVSGSIWAKFNSYVAGDEDDTASTGSGKIHDSAAGPFARVAGDSPTLSRTPSSNDLYNTYANSLGRAPTQATPTGNSRYAPGVYTPRSSLEQQRHSTQDTLRPANSELSRPSLAPQHYSSRPVSSAGSNYEPYPSQSQGTSHAPRTQSYLSTPPSQPDHVQENAVAGDSSSYPYQQYKPTPPSESSITQDRKHTSFDRETIGTTQEATMSPYEAPASYEPHPLINEHLTPSFAPGSRSYEFSSSYQAQAAQQEPSTSYEPSKFSYESAASSGYEPPTYDPPSYDYDAQQTDLSPIEAKPKKSVMDLDDDDDFEARALRAQEKARKDREADEAFRKAAEADARKDIVPKLNSKKSWFGGGWFGGKDRASENGPPNAPIKVKLGEENSFYFDEQLKKWVNKKGGTSEAAATPAPPPPKGPPSRSVSAAGGLPPSSTPVPPVPPLPTGIGSGFPAMRAVSGPTSSPHIDSNQSSRTGSPAVNAMAAGDGTPPPPGASSTPPSRPATSQSGASNIDDLIGIPQARKGGTVRKGKKGRGYVDVMAK